MDLKAAGKAFTQMFPTRERFRSYLAWCEAEKKKKIRHQKQQAAIQARRDEIAAMTDQVIDEDYDPISAEVWEQINRK